MGEPSEISHREASLKTADECVLPDDRLYYVEHDLWLKPLGDVVRVGITQPLLFFTGKPRKISVRAAATLVRRRTAFAVVSTSKTDVAVLAPFELRIQRVNDDIINDPSKLAEDVYEKGWLAEITTEHVFIGAMQADEAAKQYLGINRERGVVCLKAVPDYELPVFGETCENILTQIGDFMRTHVGLGLMLHVITGDPATEVDLIDWSQKTHHELVDLKRVGKTLHAVFRKTS